MDKETLDFGRVHDEYRQRIRRYVARLVGEHEADDLTQEVFLKVSRTLSGFQGNSSLSTWIYKITTNTVLDRIKSPAHRQSILELQEIDPECAVPVIDDSPLSIDQQLIREQMNECIRGVVEKLPPEYRTVIALSEMEDLKNSEIADVLGISLDATKIRLHRARTALKKELEGKCDFYRDGRNEFACEPKPSSIKFK